MLMTYMTQPSFARTARDLDDDLLCLQKGEAYDLLEMLLSGSKGREPAMYMWKGYESALITYGMMMCLEWHQHRRNEDKVFWLFKRASEDRLKFRYAAPPWLRDPDVATSHRSALRRAKPDYYADLWPKTPANMPLLWPVVEGADYVLKVSKADKGKMRTGELVLSDWSRVVNL